MAHQWPSSLRSPCLVGAFPHSADLAVPPDLAGVALTSSGHPVVWSGGSWRDDEVRTVRHVNGTVMVVGQCFAGDQRLVSAAERALTTGNWESLTRLPGSYLTIVVSDNGFAAFADLAGQYPLYYVQTAGRTVFGTDLRGTAAAARLTARPDPLTIAAQLFCPATPVLTEGRSVLLGVSVLGGGQALRAAAEGTCQRWTYEPLAPDDGVSLAEGASDLRAALDRAVLDRVRASQWLSADFSGGHDSTAVAFLAARHRAEPLPVFTYHNPHAPAGDLEFAQRFALLEPRLRLEVVLGEAFTYQELPDSTSDLPDPSAGSWPRTRLRLSRIAERGAGIHLGGEGADALLSAPPAYLADLAVRGQLRQLIRDTGTHARQRAESPATVLATAVRLSRTPMSSALRGLARSLEHPVIRNAGWRDAISWWPRPGVEATWLTGSMRRQLAQLAEATAESVAGLPHTRVGDLVALTELRASAAVQRQLGETARSFSVWPQAPFLDNDVIRACTRVPAHRRVDPRATKPLLRTALSGLVPDEVFTRNTKGNYSGEDYRGARARASALQARIAGSPLVELGIIEPAAVIASLDHVRTGAQIPIATFNRCLGADLWLASSAREGASSCGR